MLTDFDQLDLDSAGRPQTALPSPLPPQSIPTVQRAQVIHGVPTEVLVQLYADKIVVLVTQSGRIGSWLQISPPSITALPLPLLAPPSALAISLPAVDPSCSVALLFGSSSNSDSSSTTYRVYASQIAALFYDPKRIAPGDEGERRAVWLGIALKLGNGEEDEVDDKDRETFGLVMSMILECLAP